MGPISMDPVSIMPSPAWLRPSAPGTTASTSCGTPTHWASFNRIDPAATTGRACLAPPPRGAAPARLRNVTDHAANADADTGSDAGGGAAGATPPEPERRGPGEGGG